MKAISLGIFSHMRKKNYPSSIYPFTSNNVIPKDMIDNIFGIIDIVSIALSRCDKCYFHLDGIEFPLYEKSFTCQELKFILDHPYLLDKVQFLMNNKELTEIEALTYIQRTDLITN